MIFETDNLVVRKLVSSDLQAFHKMQSNLEVMQYTTGFVKNLEAHTRELEELILKYNFPDNDFWIYAVERKLDSKFIGTVALIKKDGDHEIGYRFLKEYWSRGYGTEACQGIIKYCKKQHFKKLTAYVIDANIASQRIVEKFGFKFVTKQMAEDLHLPETKYELYL